MINDCLNLQPMRGSYSAPSKDKSDVLISQLATIYE